MTFALEVLGWLIFLAGVGFSIGMHEIGHLVPAKIFGVKVTQYMVGFGPTMWSRQKGETEYGVKAVPLGGYIRMIGMYPPAPGADETKLRASSTGRFSTLMDDARKQSMDEVGPEDRDRVFYKLPILKRITVMLGGPTMNLALAFILMAIVVSIIGLPQTTTRVGAVAPCVPSASNATGAKADGTCTGGPSAAVTAGILVGDRIVSFDGVPITTWGQAQAAIRSAPEGQVPVVVERGGKDVTLTVDLRSIQLPIYDENGKATGQMGARNFVGLVPAQERQTASLATVPGIMADQTTHALTAIVTLPARVYDLVRQTVTDEPRDPNGIVGVVGVGRLTGDAVALEETPAADKAAFVLSLLAGLNLFLFLFNLIPLLPLDGGHVAGALWEGIKRGSARLRHLPTPPPVDIAKALPLTYVVSGLLLVLGAVTIVADLVKPLTLQ
ncbi:MAG TPA: site-2 protease family protein [Candidatus Nanopelagicales bacterium]|nr:site-2 protease family protein [Candidatus Nanopelagicales bacterium]